ncbi:hypothetical protein MA16_Dca011930 [Dendrobium catenatum]|uniref:Uncharacterized protein n=1 Tax=Dendrobium catenatum TaxID=906689 RepID=A0A2I0WWZ9_9ASPA|nr:hypothetical protein MA16_Dca011930 [Dendrobium catenatum]
MRVLKWTPFFDVKEESPIVPIWISFPNLRLHFFNPKVLHALGLIFGRPLQTDQATAARTRPSVARILVEVDISKKHPKEVWVGSKAFGYLQKVEFEKTPDFCQNCKIHGHSVNECFKLHPHLKKIVVQNKEGIVSEENQEEILSNNAENPVNLEQNLNVINETVNPGFTENSKNKFSVLVDLNEENEVVSNVCVKEPNIYISIDSMLNSPKDMIDHVHKQVDLSNEQTSTEKEGCEEGEFIPNLNNESDLYEVASNITENKEDSFTTNDVGKPSSFEACTVWRQLLSHYTNTLNSHLTTLAHCGMSSMFSSFSVNFGPPLLIGIICTY